MMRQNYINFVLYVASKNQKKILPPGEHYQCGGDGGVEGFGGFAALSGGRDGDAVCDNLRHFIGDAVRLVADDYNVVGTKSEIVDVLAV